MNNRPAPARTALDDAHDAADTLTAALREYRRGLVSWAVVEAAHERSVATMAAAAVELDRAELAARRRPANLAPEFGCYSMSHLTGRVCTLEFGHDEAHTAHDVNGPAETWERAATDRTASEHEATGAAPVGIPAPGRDLVSELRAMGLA